MYAELKITRINYDTYIIDSRHPLQILFSLLLQIRPFHPVNDQLSFLLSCVHCHHHRLGLITARCAERGWWWCFKSSLSHHLLKTFKGLQCRLSGFRTTVESHYAHVVKAQSSAEPGSKRHINNHPQGHEARYNLRRTKSLIFLLQEEGTMSCHEFVTSRSITEGQWDESDPQSLWIPLRYYSTSLNRPLMLRNLQGG